LRAQTSRCRDKLASLNDRATRAFAVASRQRQERFAAVSARLAVALRANADAQRTHIARCRQRVEALAVRAQPAARHLLPQRAAMLARSSQLLAALSSRGVLARGFALGRDAERRPLRSVTQVSPALAMEIEFADGRVGARAEGAPTPFAPPRIPRTRR